ncbi:MAG: cellulase family glycosylhydrolase [Prevotellaceae bacterium]|jgi:endo-1,4-beta-mannosidase|nr:cellulase family glycosylhydrolase [Prevotellaceae bacterium]
MVRKVLLSIVFLTFLQIDVSSQEAGTNVPPLKDGQWSIEQINSWYEAAGWFNGVNYIPSDAINYTAMWDRTSFNPKLIDRELALAEELGFNCVRVVLQHAVYADDPKYFLKTLDRFLAICDRRHIRVMPCFFDDCAFGVNTDPVAGKQPEPLTGWYAWAWSPSPGHTMVVDERYHPQLETYVKDVIRKFKDDRRIFLWDLYNEPNSELGVHGGVPLYKKVFVWAREIKPVQPLTIGLHTANKELNQFLLDNSDIISFHNYSTKENMKNQIADLKQYGRPVLCSEWMNRPSKSTVEDVMPLLKEENVGAIMWGLVNGKTQTDLPWGFRPEKLPYTGEWQHDLFHGDFTPYRESELALIKQLNGK